MRRRGFLNHDKPRSASGRSQFQQALYRAVHVGIALSLRTFVFNTNLDVRRSVIPQLDLNPDSYSEEDRPLVEKAIRIARESDDEYIWSYIWSPRELMLLTAMDFDTACVRAKRFRFSWKGRSVADLIEPIARFELQLAEGVAGYAPTCFRVWIDGHKVGWPPTEDQEPRRSDPPPGTPLAAEARLPIPEYAHTYAYGPGTRRKHGRRLDIPWRGRERN